MVKKREMSTKNSAFPFGCCVAETLGAFATSLTMRHHRERMNPDQLKGQSQARIYMQVIFFVTVTVLENIILSVVEENVSFRGHQS